MVTLECVLQVPGGARIAITRGDITQCRTSAIVNAANTHMQGGSGVDGAIHRAAGSELLVACSALPVVTPPSTRLPVGRAMRLPSGKLAERGIKHVIATVGPKYKKHFPVDADALLLQAHDSCLDIAAGLGDCTTIAFPAVSCGAYAFPVERAARNVLTHVLGRAVGLKRDGGIDEVRFVLYDQNMFRTWAGAAEVLAD